MNEFIFFEESWNTGKEDEICSIHQCLLDKDGNCKKCLEENNK